MLWYFACMYVSEDVYCMLPGVHVCVCVRDGKSVCVCVCVCVCVHVCVYVRERERMHVFMCDFFGDTLQLSNSTGNMVQYSHEIQRNTTEKFSI